MSDILPSSVFEQAVGRAPGTKNFSRQQRLLANLGIVCFLGLATALSMAETDFVAAADRPAWRAWGAPIGMKQWWKVFADVRTVNYHSAAVIEFADGTNKYYEFPRADQMPLAERFVKAPESIFFGEQIANLHNQKFLPAVARYLVRANFDRDNPPAQITFEVNSADIVDPHQKPWIWQDHLLHHNHRQIYFVYIVTPADLSL